MLSECCFARRATAQTWLPALSQLPRCGSGDTSVRWVATCSDLVRGSSGLRFGAKSRGTAGPFAAEWSDFAEFDPATRRSTELAARVSQLMDEAETSAAH